jgi:serpin B
VIREVPRRGVVLANATYFFGEWSAPFDEENTKPMPFISPAGGGDPDTIQVPTMSRKTKYPYVEQEIDGQERPLQGVRVPYGETGRLAMYVFVPPDLNEFIRELGPERWDKFTGAMDSVEVKLKLPKFTLRKTADLKPSLRRLGVEKAFTPAANFRPVFNIGTEAGADSLLDGQLGPLFLSEVRQKVYLKVNEKGTEAAAVSVGLAELSAAPKVKVNRPFYFAIAEREMGAILFHGAIRNPVAQ